MSRSRDSSNPLADLLGKGWLNAWQGELKGLFQLWRRWVPAHALNPTVKLSSPKSLSPVLVATQVLPLQAVRLHVFNPLAFKNIRMGKLAKRDWDLALVYPHLSCYAESVGSSLVLACHGISFQPARARVQGVPLNQEKTLQPKAWSLPVSYGGRLKKTAIHSLAVGRFKVVLTPQSFTRLRCQSLRGRRKMLAIPMSREPIPIHRFTPEERRIFRAQLAQQAKTMPGNIILKQVYSPLFRDMVQSVRQDASGMLLCDLKEDKIFRSKGPTADYLVVGQQINPQQTITAFVAMTFDDAPKPT